MVFARKREEDRQLQRMKDVTNTFNAMQMSPQLSLKEFTFSVKSPIPSPMASTPSKMPSLKTLETPVKPSPTRSRSHMGFVNRKKHVQDYHRLQPKRSHLDNMLDQKLTSFPLAPPRPKNSSPSVQKSPEFNATDLELGSSKTNSPLDNTSIVLVEDYIKQKTLGRKKLSVSELKKSMKAFEPEDSVINEEAEMDATTYLSRAKSILTLNDSSKLPPSGLEIGSSSNSLLLTSSYLQGYDNEVWSTPCTSQHSTVLGPSSDATRYSSSSLTGSMATLKLSDTNEYPRVEFSIATDSSLKYCVICETPLYDISSHLVGTTKNYTEFVCCNCTEKYEVLSRLLDEFDTTLSGLTTIPEDIDDIEEALAQPSMKRRKNTEFSKTLVDRLKGHLRDGSPAKRFEMMDRTSAIWLLEAKKKLRWRWRISGLVPRFMKRNEQSNTNDV